MIAIVDYGVNNLGSIENMLRKVGAQAASTADAEVVDRADGIILPGVGSFDAAVRALDASGLVDALGQRWRAGTPFLGICLGMQLLCRRSEEGELPGLGWVEADVVRIHPDDRRFHVPHIGWSPIQLARDAQGVDLRDGTEFYFLHAYEVRPDDPDDVVATCEHGGTRVAAIQHGTLFGVQFHPEKSLAAGMALLGSFARTVEEVTV